jgi:hypothetical protein
MTTLFPRDFFPVGSETAYDQYMGSQEELKEMFDEHRRRYTALLQFEGVPCKLLQLKVSGDRCPYWSEESGHCPKPLTEPKCFNTGWVGGYEKPVDILVRFMQPGTTRTWYREGVRVTQEVKSWSIYRPLLKTWDVIVKSRTGERFFLQDVTGVPPWKDDMILYQEFSLKLVTSEPVRFLGPTEGLILP